MDQNQINEQTGIFAVEPKDYIISLGPDVEQITSPHDNYRVYNIGCVDVHVYLLQGLYENWQTASDEIIVKPGQTAIFDNVGQVFRVTAIKISNKSEIRAVIYCRYADFSFREILLTKPSECDRGYSDNLRETYSLCIKFIPYISKQYRGLYEAFWPSNSLSVWDQILLKLQPLLKTNVFEAISITVNEFMENFQRKLHALSIDFDTELPVYDIYMNIATDLDEFDRKFVNPQCVDNCSATNMLLLPLFSNFVLLKTTFHALGIIHSSRMGFTYNDISRIQNLLKSTIKASKYINNLLDECLNHAYNHSHLNNLFNSMMDVRSYIAIHGIEFTRLWDTMVRNPFNGNILTDTISYSNFFGRQTPNLIREATCRKMYPPLTPFYIGFIYNYLTSIEVYLWINYLSPQIRKIGGMKLTFADHSSYIMGTKTGLIEQVDFMKAYIIKLEVTGNNAVDSCTFHMSDGRTLFFGTRESNCEEKIFELKDHRIVSIFLSSDDESLGGQAANIAVSYRLNNVWE